MTINIGCVCNYDYLPHFFKMAYRASMVLSDYRIHLLYVCEDETQSFKAKLKEVLHEDYCTTVGFLLKNPEVRRVEESGRLMLYDWLRAGMCGYFNLDHCLYLDVDCDIVGDFSDTYNALVNNGTSIAAPPDLTASGDVQQEVAKHCNSREVYSIGAVWMNTDLRADLEDIMRFCMVDIKGGFCPGMSVWNILMHRRAGLNDFTALPPTFSCNWYAGEANVRYTDILQYGGRFKELHQYANYEYNGEDAPHTIIINHEKMVDVDMSNWG